MSTLQVTPSSGSRGSKFGAKGGGYVGATLSRDDSTLHLPDETAHAHPSGSLTARQTSATAARREGNKADFQRLQKKKEHTVKHERLVAARERDDAALKDAVVKAQEKREQRFQEMMEEVRHNDEVRVYAAHIIQQYEREQEKKRRNLWATYDKEVSQRIEMQLNHFMTRKDPNSRDPAVREEIRPSDNPAKQSVNQMKAEENFRRIADSIIHSGKALGDSADIKEQIKLREAIEHSVANRPTVRPTLPVELWGQQELFALPDGYFSQRCERMDRGEAFHSIRRTARPGLDCHQPDESDGVPAAGKKLQKNRLETKFHHMGILVGDHAKVGDAYRHKRDHGAGCAAPLQDHYFYEKGNDVVESEFPVGKRCFPHLVQK